MWHSYTWYLTGIWSWCSVPWKAFMGSWRALLWTLVEILKTWLTLSPSALSRRGGPHTDSPFVKAQPLFHTALLARPSRKNSSVEKVGLVHWKSVFLPPPLGAAVTSKAVFLSLFSNQSLCSHNLWDECQAHPLSLGFKWGGSTLSLCHAVRRDRKLTHWQPLQKSRESLSWVMGPGSQNS